jgi:hypothetical protein
VCQDQTTPMLIHCLRRSICPYLLPVSGAPRHNNEYRPPGSLPLAMLLGSSRPKLERTPARGIPTDEHRRLPPGWRIGVRDEPGKPPAPEGYPRPTQGVKGPHLGVGKIEILAGARQERRDDPAEPIIGGVGRHDEHQNDPAVSVLTGQIFTALPSYFSELHYHCS